MNALQKIKPNVEGDETISLVSCQKLETAIESGEFGYKDRITFDRAVKRIYEEGRRAKASDIRESRQNPDRVWVNKDVDGQGFGSRLWGIKAKEGEYCPLTEARVCLYQKQLPRWSRRLKGLAKAGVLNSDRHYVVQNESRDGKGKAIGYWLPEDTEFCVVEVQYKDVWEAVDNDKVVTNYRYSKGSTLFDIGFDSDFVFTYDAPEDTTYLENLGAVSIPTQVFKDSKTLTKAYELLRVLTEPTVYNSLTGRYYSPFVELPSEIRSKVAEANGLYEIDLRCSQPTLLAALSGDLQLKADAETGDIYERFAKALGIENRDDAKTLFNIVMNTADKGSLTAEQRTKLAAMDYDRKNGTTTAKINYHQLLSDRYSAAYEVINHFKAEDLESLGGHLLSRIEADVLDLEDKTGVIPAHDALYIPKDRSAAAVTQEVQDNINNHPALKIEVQAGFHISKTEKTEDMTQNKDKPEYEAEEPTIEEIKQMDLYSLRILAMDDSELGKKCRFWLENGHDEKVDTSEPTEFEMTFG